MNKQNPLTKKNQHGVSLIELMIVLSVIAIMMGISLALANKVMETSRVNKAASLLGLTIEQINDAWLPDNTGRRNFSAFPFGTIPATPGVCPAIPGGSPISAGTVACLSLTSQDAIRGNTIIDPWSQLITVIPANGPVFDRYALIFPAIPRTSCVKFLNVAIESAAVERIATNGGPSVAASTVVPTAACTLATNAVSLQIFPP